MDNKAFRGAIMNHVTV